MKCVQDSGQEPNVEPSAHRVNTQQYRTRVTEPQRIWFC
jgi:hypothetical protein